MMNGIRKTPRQVFQDTVCKINVTGLYFKDEDEKEFVVTCMEKMPVGVNTSAN